ncbi:MAG: purine-nucleoside phosphorylase [Deltaproteobacteria bacterium]|nr:purine-nucleoside phosphorylase [Deltaproteobacteria bacterium]
MPISDPEVKLEQAVAAVRAAGAAEPRVGVVLGSGLGAFVESLVAAVRVSYADIPHMPGTTVVGHAGALCVGTCGGLAVACLQGRAHLYEGHAPERVVFGVRLLARLGCAVVLLTNAAGGVRTSFRPGTLMLVTDHINLTGRSPLVGPNEDGLGPRFPDLTRAYDPELAELARKAAADLGIGLEAGVYAALLGPSYETPAEIGMLRLLGADAVGMSTVPEVIALRHMGVRVGAISCITNMAAGITGERLDHAEVERTARHARDAFVGLLAGWIRLMGEAGLAGGGGRTG